MPTTAKLTIVGLTHIDVAYDSPGEAWRHLYGTEGFLKALDRTVNADEESAFGSDLRLPDQLDNLFDAFVSGRRLYHDREFHCMSPTSASVWELKTVDLRVFGWFLKRDHFACVSLVKADAAKAAGEYSGFDALYPHLRGDVVRTRRIMKCDSKFCVTGTEPYDVVSVRDRI